MVGIIAPAAHHSQADRSSVVNQFLFFQDFQLEKRLDNKLIELAQPVIDGVEKKVDIEMEINNECRAFASTLSYNIAM